MASHSDELVTRINHADINCEIVRSIGISNYVDVVKYANVFKYAEVAQLEKCLRALIKRIGDYLTRVVGSVPIDLKITLQVHDERPSEYRTTPETIGPFYYEGQEAMSESEEER